MGGTLTFRASFLLSSRKFVHLGIPRLVLVARFSRNLTDRLPLGSRLGNSDAFEKKDHQWRWEREKELELYKGSIVERRRNKACSKRLLADSGRLMRDSRSRD